MAAFDSATFSEPKELRILRVTPDGADVPMGQQIVIQFNRPVVPLGSMERTAAEIPVTIDPALPCQWRWLNTSALACNLDEQNALRAATSYHVTIAPGIKAEDGQTIPDDFIHQFTTERPDVRYSWFKSWLSPSMPVIRLTFNQSVSKQSVEESLLMVDAENALGKTYALSAKPDPDDRELPDYLPLPGTHLAVDTSDVAPQKSDDDVRKTGGVEARRVWLVAPTQELPLDATISLKVRPGLVSALGAEKGIGDREQLRFNTFPEFAFLGVRCYTNENDSAMVLIPPDAPAGEILCNPMRGASLAFSSPVFRSQIKNNLQFTPPLNVNAQADIWGSGEEYSQLSSAHEKGRTYDIWLPAGIKAATQYRVQSNEVTHGFFERAWLWIVGLFSDEEPAQTELRDEFDRPLQQRIDMVFRSNHRKPNFEIIHHDAVIEKQIDSDVPLYVNNLNKTTFSYRRLTADGAQTGLSSVQEIPQVQDIQFAIPFKLREMLGGKSGAVFGQLSTDPLVSKYPSDHRLFAQVTPYQMHVKLGHFNSTVWVTDLATGAPVAGAKVSIYTDKLTELNAMKTLLSSAITGADGVATLAGTETLDPELDVLNRWREEEERLFVRVDHDGDMAIMPINNDFIIDPYRSVGESVYYDNARRYGHIHTWGTTAQGIYRVGDTVQYKLYVRNQDNRSFTPAPREGYSLVILDPTGNEVKKVKHLKLNAFGAYAGEFELSDQAAVGWYQFQLSANFNAPKPKADASEEEPQDEFTWQPMRVLVSDFTPSPFKVSNQVNGDLFHAEQEVQLDTTAKLHSGGAYTDAGLRVTAMLSSTPFVSEHPLAKDFTFGSYSGYFSETQVFQKMDTVDSKGENSLKFSLPKENIYYGRLMFESAVQDDRGKYVAAQSYADYAGVDRFVGLRTKSWMFDAGKPAAIEYLVTNARGEPTAGSKVTLAIERQETVAAKVKGAGNAYLTEFTNRWVAAHTCEGVSQTHISTCEFTPEKAGYYRATATTTDTKGREHRTQLSMYVVGGGHVLWSESDDNSLEIIPEKASYQVGEKARYLVKNPYPGAQALVTIERYGVIDHFVQTLTGSAPVIEFEVKPDYLPGYYLSVVAFSPRVEKPIENQVDLGKPSFRIGYISVPISDPHKEMRITAKTDRKVYKPREKVVLSLHAAPRVTDKSEPIEIAVAVLDESVFDLVAGGKNYYDPYQGFYTLEGLDLRNYSLLTRLVGRQKFEKKGANPGGDGGSDLAMRNQFKFISYWNPSITPDAAGNAKVEFEVPDNLTGWRVLAMAVTPSDRMGLGDANFKVNRPTEARPVMPNQVTEGDRFDAGFSIMNRTDKTRKLTVTIDASGDIDAKNASAHVQQKITLKPYKRSTVWLPLKAATVAATASAKAGAIHFRVTAEDALDGDATEHRLLVHKRRSLETTANYGTTTKDTVSESIAFPKNIHTDVGEVSIVAAPSIIGNIEGAFEYMRDYAYSCWEQQLTKAVMASHYLNLREYMPADVAWKEARTLPKKTLKAAASFQAPSGGMAYFVPQDQYADPYLSAYTALAFNWLKKSGYDVPEEVERKLHSYLDNLLRQDVYPDFYDKGMAATVRAVALAALAQNNKLTLEDLERYRSHVAQMSLFGKNYFVQAAMQVNGAEAYADEVAKLMLSHANQSGGKFTFSEELDDSYSRILASPLRENCAILSTFSALGQRAAGKDLVGDVPLKLVRMITQARGSRTHWENTQENVFCLNALTDYARIYESTKPAMQVAVEMDDKKLGETTFSDVKNPAVTFTRPLAAGDAGRNTTAAIHRTGEGRLYYATRLSFAPLEEHAKPTNAGIEIRREYSVQRDGKWQLLSSPASIKPAEVVRVDIFLSLAAARNFVVVDDPIPGGLEPVNRDLATASVVDADAGEFEAAGGSWWFKYSDWASYNVSRWSFYHKELRHDAARFYADYLPAGNYHLSYTAQAIAPGEFTIMPVHAEEMYDPDVYGKGIPEQLKVSAQKP